MPSTYQSGPTQSAGACLLCCELKGAGMGLVQAVFRHCSEGASSTAGCTQEEAVCRSA